jgi:uncharacterized membrane protein YfhO
MDKPLAPLDSSYEIRWNGLFRRFQFSRALEDYDGILIHESIYPGWQAFVDGQPVEIETGDCLFKFLKFEPSEKHVIELQYFPESFRKGFNISFVFGIIWVALFIGAMIRNRKRESQS